MCHDVANLGVIDGSVFVTAGAVNPTSTICALALRAAEHLVETRSSVPRPAERSVFAARVSPSVPVPVTPRPAVIATEARARLGELADVLIPAADGMPAATEVDVAGPHLDWVLSARPDLAPVLERILAEPFDDPATRLRELAGRDRAGYDALTLIVVAAYYHDERVRAAIGYPGQIATPIPARDFPEYITEDLLPTEPPVHAGVSDQTPSRPPSTTSDVALT
jgi:hypothetical protein